MNQTTPVDQQTSYRNRLVHLLDYMAVQTSDMDIARFVMPAPLVNSLLLQGLPGIEISPPDHPVWFSIQRLTIPPLPIVESSFKVLIRVSIDTAPELEHQSLMTQLGCCHPLKSNGLLKFPVAPAHGFLNAAECLRGLNAAFVVITTAWQDWFIAKQQIEQSTRIYDLLFSWKTNITLAVSAKPTEIVAGVGLIGWQLPDTGHHYLYPLITQPIEIDFQDNGVIQVSASESAPRLEMDAFLGQASLPQAPALKKQLLELLNDGRQIHIADDSTYRDIVQMAMTRLDAQGIVREGQAFPPVTPLAQASLGWTLFARQQTSSVLEEDIQRLRSQLEQGTDIPVASISLVQEASAQVKPAAAVQFRGQSGIEGSGNSRHELFFPLPYNKEQVTIIQKLLQEPGVVVQGPPGTGKTHTIANIVAHYLATGKKVLVTAQQGHVLKTVQEKLPESLRPLVVSRVGSSSESRRQLEYAIDQMIQKLSQMQPDILRQEISLLLKQVDSAHISMAEIDRQIYDFALTHFSDIEIDGSQKRAHEIADMVLAGQQAYHWFEDELSLDVQHQFPLQDQELSQLKQARQNAGPYLARRTTHLPSLARLPDLTSMLTLHRGQQQRQQLLEKQKNATYWPLSTLADSVQLQKFEALIETVVALTREYQDLLIEHAWLDQLRSKFADRSMAAEISALKLLLPEMQTLCSYRQELLRHPVSVPAQAFNHPKIAEAIERGVETGKPLAWFHFTQKELEPLIRQITISGKEPVSPDEWRQIRTYMQVYQQIRVFCSRWNVLQDALALPEMVHNGISVEQLLRKFAILHQAIQLTVELAEQYDPALYQQFHHLFSKKLSLSFFYRCEQLERIRQQLQDQHSLEQSFVIQQQLDTIRHMLSQSDDALTQQLQQFFSRLGNTDDDQTLTADYKIILEQLRTYEDLAIDFEIITAAMQKFEISGAVLLSQQLGTPFDPKVQPDPALRPDLLAAWRWARLKHYASTLGQQDQLNLFSHRRKQLEQFLAASYELLASQQAWLSLKESTSDKVLTALQRYKTAVQKIGKGTGKNAARYRKDAQQAMQEAAEAIPCWVMTHYQVSETMPAQLGLFDLIIIDEASQSTLEALPVLLRGKKILVVGDDKQVSPANVGLSSEKIELLRAKYLSDQPHASILTPDMSLYDMASSLYPSIVMLLEHFRCHPDIIDYSNRNFYDHKIKPMRISRQSERIDPPLISIYLPEGSRSGTSTRYINVQEADAIIAEMKTLLANPLYNKRTIGVISLLGNAQAEYIQTRALDVFGAATLSQVSFAAGDASAFQGAERDIIFLSMVADPVNCYPLSRRDHEQRLNVAASRARERMYLVHCVKLEHLSPKDLRVALLHHYFSSSKMTPQCLEDKLSCCESGFEREVLQALYERGYWVTPQVKAGSYRIDLVVEGSNDTRLAIECDGDTFHGPEQWPQDMQRQRILERAGWTFWRCFASTWKLQQATVLEDLISTLHAMGIFPQLSEEVTPAHIELREWTSAILSDTEQIISPVSRPEEIAEIRTQQCMTCLKVYPLSDFYEYYRMPNHYTSDCIGCLNARFIYAI